MKNSRLDSGISFGSDMIQGEAIPATIKARYLASVVDTILASIVSGVVAAALDRHQADNDTIQFAAVLAYLSYTIILTALNGETVGKKVLQIRVVKADGSKVSAVQVLLRETIGRLLFIPIFFVSFFRADRAGIHDLISGTRVVSTDPYAAEAGMSGGRKAILTSVVLSSLSGVVIYVFLFTPYPIRQFADRLELQGFEIKGVGGSLAFGPSFEDVRFDSESLKYQLRNLRLRYDLWALYRDNRIVIKNISVESGDFFTSSGVMNALAGEKRENSSDAITDAKKNSAPKKALGFMVERIDIANLQFKTEEKTFNLKRFYIDSFVIENKTLKLGRAWVESDALDLDVNGLLLSKESLRAEQYVKGTIKKSLFPKYLAGDVSFEGKFDVDPSQKMVREVSLGLCDRRLQLRKDADGYVVQTYGLTISKCFNMNLPLNNASVRVKFRPPLYQGDVQEGNVSLRNFPFKYVKQYGFIYQRGPRTYAFKFEPTMLWILMGPSFPITSNQLSSEEEWMADLYYGRSWTYLSSLEQEGVTQDVKYFRSAASGFGLALKGATATQAQPAAELPRALPGKMTPEQKALVLHQLQEQAKRRAALQATQPQQNRFPSSISRSKNSR